MPFYFSDLIFISFLLSFILITDSQFHIVLLNYFKKKPSKKEITDEISDKTFSFFFSFKNLNISLTKLSFLAII